MFGLVRHTQFTDTAVQVLSHLHIYKTHTYMQTQTCKKGSVQNLVSPITVIGSIPTEMERDLEHSTLVSTVQIFLNKTNNILINVFFFFCIKNI